jgi:hypothetical protein
MSVKVTGTLSKPQYKVNKSPVKILQKTGGVILENVSQFSEYLLLLIKETQSFNKQKTNISII